jgi:hypothetical protein
MKINLVINGTEKQIRSFFTEFLGEARTTNLLEVLQDSDAIEQEDLSENPLYEHFNSLSWETCYLAHLVEVHGQTDALDNKYLTYEEITALVGIKERQISSRIGGSNKVANKLDGVPWLKSGSKKGKAVCILNADARPVLMYALNESKEAYQEWLDEEGLDNPDEL